MRLCCVVCRERRALSTSGGKHDGTLFGSALLTAQCATCIVGSAVKPEGSLSSEDEQLCFNDGGECLICRNQMKNPLVLPCKHQFCKSCVRQLAKAVSGNNGCPLCRAPIPLCRAQKLYAKAHHMFNHISQQQAHQNRSLAATNVRELYKEVEGLYRQAIESDPDMADAHHGLGIVLATIGDQEQVSCGRIYVLN